MRIGLLVAMGLLVGTAAAAGAQGAAPPDLNRDLRVLRQEIRNLRKDLNGTRADLESARKEIGAVEQRHGDTVSGLRSDLQAMRGRVDLLTGLVVLLGVAACLALVTALRKRAGSGSEPGELARARSRIAELRAQFAADEARRAELARPTAKEPETVA